MKDFMLPTNVKQIGKIGPGTRIYMEDYVHTYLFQYAQTSGHVESIAFLIGAYKEIENESCVFICGAIQGKYPRQKDGMLIFSEESFQYMTEEVDKYFEGYQIVGWVLSQPGFGKTLNPFYANYHLSQFPSEELLFVLDPVERTSVFYERSKDEHRLKDVEGYFVYYDKNEGMNEYMLDNKLTRQTMPERQLVQSELLSSRIPREEGKNRINPSMIQGKTPEGTGRVRLLSGFSFVLLGITLALGVGFVRSTNRISDLEDNIAVMNTAYNYLANQLQMAMEPVFASGEEDKNILPETSETPVETPAETPVIPVETIAPPTEIETATPPPVATETIEPRENTESPATEIPVETLPPTTISSIPDSYMVQQGDSLISISKKFYGDDSMVEAIMRLNNLENPELIFFGKTLLLPQGE